MAKKVMRFVVGERAITQGMDDVLMNGKRCTNVCDFMKDQGRYGVELCDGVRCKIKPTNLSLVTDEDTDKRTTLFSSLAELIQCTFTNLLLGPISSNLLEDMKRHMKKTAIKKSQQ
jgi:hypothetical protein